MLRDLEPMPHAVYRVYDKHDRLLYVGISCDPDQRLAAHAHTADWAGEYDRHTLTWHDSRTEALAVEAEVIRSECPVHNVKGRPFEPKPARVTLNLPPELYRQLQRWTDSAAETLDVPRVGVQETMRAMIRVLTSGEAVSWSARVQAELRIELRS